MSNSEETTQKSIKRWSVELYYRCENTNIIDNYTIDEIEELQGIIENLDDWNKIEDDINIVLTYNFKEKI